MVLAGTEPPVETVILSPTTICDVGVPVTVIVVPERVAVASDAARTFDVPTTRRRPVVFEEDDDLDVPDFLK